MVNNFADAEMVIGSIWGDEKLDLTINKDITSFLFYYLEIITEKMNASIPAIPAAGSRWSEKRSSNYTLH